MKNRLLFILLLALPIVVFSQNDSKPIALNVIQETVNIDHKPIKVFNIVQNDGKEGYVGYKGQMFNVILHNKTNVPITVHWHGLIDPYKDDGVPYVTQLPLAPGHSQHIKFPLVQAGTYWMHSHYKVQEARLLAAPLIIKNANSQQKNIKNVVVMLEDFTFKSPTAVLKMLQTTPDIEKMPDMSKGKSSLDLYDVKSDLFLANRRTLNNPEIIKVTKGETIRLRLINAAIGNNFYVDLPKGVIGKLIAIDGENIQNLFGYRFQVSVANRLDVIIKIPNRKGAYPILFQAEGRKMRSGIILATSGAVIPNVSLYAKRSAPAFTYIQDFNAHALKPLPKKSVTRTLIYHLTGDMMKYKWGINNQYWPKVTPEFVKKGDRVKLVIINDTNMSHPMHFHGHVFQLVSIDGNHINGYEGDTILVLPKSRVSLIFDANNPGIWAFHCHLLYHQAVGMMTTINYVGFPAPKFYLNEIKMSRQQYLALEKKEAQETVEKGGKT